MAGDLVDRSIRTSLIATAVVFPFAAVYLGSLSAIGFLAASLWSTANVWVISIVVGEYLGGRRWSRLAVMLCVKFPVLYGLGLWGVSQRVVPVVSVLVGFHMIFLVLILKILSRWLLVPVGTDPVSRRKGGVISGTRESA